MSANVTGNVGEGKDSQEEGVLAPTDLGRTFSIEKIQTNLRFIMG